MIYPYQIEPYQKMCQTTSVTNEGIKNLARYLKLTKTNLSVSITIMRQNKMMYRIHVIWAPLLNRTPPIEYSNTTPVKNLVLGQNFNWTNQKTNFEE